MVSKFPTGAMRKALQENAPHLLTIRRRMVEEFVHDLTLTNDHLHIVEHRMSAAIKQGLSPNGHETSSVRCFPTYVSRLPTGNEVGKFLSLDLGGTNFRIMIMEIKEEKGLNMDSETFPVPKDVMIGPGTALFDHISACLSQFLNKWDIKHLKLPLGFTFSFPCHQKGLDKAILEHWTKGFSCSDVEGHDVCQLLREAIARRGDIKIDVCAVLNDTTGCLMSCAWREPNCRMGLIFGTGTNACYLEQISNIGTIDAKEFPEQKNMVVNTEWGAFGDNGELEFILTKWDRAIQKDSYYPGTQTFEKMVSGMYLGELVRQVLLDLIHDNLIFAGCNTKKLLEKGSFLTKFASEIEKDPIGEYTRARKCLDSLGMDPLTITEEDFSSLRFVCEAITRRAAFLASAGVAALLKQMDYKDMVIAIDGSLFRHHPHFKNVMTSRISQLMGKNYEFDLMLSEDGSGRGAALVAAVLKARNMKREA